jgi:hypothetical protein
LFEQADEDKIENTGAILTIVSPYVNDVLFCFVVFASVVSDVSGHQVWIRSLDPHIDGDTADGSM